MCLPALPSLLRHMLRGGTLTPQGILQTISMKAIETVGDELRFAATRLREWGRRTNFTSGECVLPTPDASRWAQGVLGIEGVVQQHFVRTQIDDAAQHVDTLILFPDSRLPRLHHRRSVHASSCRALLHWTPAIQALGGDTVECHGRLRARGQLLSTFGLGDADVLAF